MSISLGINQFEITELLTVIELLTVGTPVTASKNTIGKLTLKTVKPSIIVGCEVDMSIFIEIL